MDCFLFRERAFNKESEPVCLKYSKMVHNLSKPMGAGKALHD